MVNNIENIFLNLKDILKAKANYHPALKVVAYQRKKDAGNFASKRMFNYLCKEAGEDNNRLQQLNEQVKYLVNFPRIQGLFMEIFGGYKRI